LEKRAHALEAKEQMKVEELEAKRIEIENRVRNRVSDRQRSQVDM
jgi:hypothetical protein